jgi:Zn-dependent metalloprotease
LPPAPASTQIFARSFIPHSLSIRARDAELCHSSAVIEQRTRTVTIWALAALLLSLAFSAQARAGGGASSLARALGPGVDVTAQSEAGSDLTFIGTDPGTAIPLRAATPRAAALEAGGRFGSRFGLGVDAELRVAGLQRLRDGRSAAHLEQTIDGLPVLGGELAVGLTATGDMLSIGGELEPEGGVDTRPAIGADSAATTAIAAVAKSTGVPSTELQASSPVLSIYDPRILGGPGIDLPRAVWRLEVRDDASPVTVRNLVLVDADLGNVALSFSEIEDAKNRIVCNAESEPKLVPCTALEAELEEGDDPTAAAPEAALAYTLTGDLYDFYKDQFGRDSIDGGGMPLISTVSYCEEEKCPFENAFWDGEQMVYGDGLVTDDVTGHELTHGVNGSESHLFYYYQSGALDEGIADIFGELFDLSTPSFPSSGDKTADRWKIGEDSSIGTIRKMSDPPAFGQPDRTGSGDWFYEPDADLVSADNGGVHENSGVAGKAAFLMTDGTKGEPPFNGQTISGLGIEKALQIHYDAITNLLTSASDYQDYSNALRQACSDLVGEHEITATDCEQVEKTVRATEMETPPPSAAPARASACAGGQTPELAFSDDLEDPGSGNWAAGSLLFEHPNVFFYPQVPNTAGLDATYASSGTTNIWGVDASSVTDSAIAMTKSVTVPSGGFMRLAHAHSFESGEGNEYDGGVIEYSTDGGAHWTDAGSLIEAGDHYGGPIFTGADNPLSGRPAFVGESTGYGSTRLDLSSLAGQQIRFRFRIGTDQAQKDYGWFIDDIEIYSCGPGGSTPPPPPPPQGETASAAPGPSQTPTSDGCAAARAALVRAQAKVARLRHRLELIRPPTHAARSAVRKAAADVRSKSAAARRTCAP